MTKKYYTVYWTDLINRSIDIEAESKEEAINKVKEGDFDHKKIQEHECEFHEEPYIDWE